MAGSRKSGPLGTDPHAQEALDDGTSARTVSPRPGPLHDHGLSRDRHVSSGMRPRPQRRAVTTLKTLREGDFGADVKKLQALLNARVTPSPALRLDGAFGPITRDAVTQYQRGVSLLADGVVGNHTWHHLLKGDQASGSFGAPAGSALHAAATTRTAFSAPPPVEGIWEWPLDKKLLAVLERVPRRLPGRARDEFLGLLNLQNLALSLAIIAGFCLLSGGTALVLGFAILGIDVSMSLATALQLAALAATPAELDEAADELAHVVLAVGVVVFLHGVGRIARGTGGAAKVEIEASKSSSIPATPSTLGRPPLTRLPEATAKAPATVERPAPLAARSPTPVRPVPRGFSNAEQYAQCMKELNEALAKSGVTDAKIGVRGSAVTGQSSKGGPFRMKAEGGRPPSDVDVFIESDQLTGKLNTRNGFAHPDKVMKDNPALEQWSERWSTKLGREITPAGFESGTVPNGAQLHFED